MWERWRRKKRKEEEAEEEEEEEEVVVEGKEEEGEEEEEEEEEVRHVHRYAWAEVQKRGELRFQGMVMPSKGMHAAMKFLDRQVGRWVGGWFVGGWV